MKHERYLINLVNMAGPINIRLHMLDLLPGLGRERRDIIIRERRIRPFNSFSEFEVRTGIKANIIIESLIKRILFELGGEEAWSDISLLRRILSLLHEQGPISRAELIRKLSIPQTEIGRIYKVLRRLYNDNLIDFASDTLISSDGSSKRRSKQRTKLIMTITAKGKRVISFLTRN